MGIQQTIKQTPTRRGGAGKKRRQRRKIPKHLAGLMGEANLCFARGEIENAATMCLEIVRQAPKSPEPYQLLSLVYEEKGEPERSLQFALLGAHLNSRDCDEWLKVIEMCMDQNNVELALYCYSKAIRSTKNKIPLLQEKLNLLDEMGEEKRAVCVKKTLLNYLPEESVDEYLQLARELTKYSHENGDESTAMKIMEKAIEKHRDYINYEDINVMAELFMARNDFEKTVLFLVNHCNVTLGGHDRMKEDGSDLSLNRITDISVPGELPIDLKVKLSICLINLDVNQEIIQKSLETLFQESSNDMGDLYLDVAEAYLEKGSNMLARPILSSLVSSKNYNLPAVWLRYADCLNSLGHVSNAAVAYKRVVETVPGHLEARLALATIEQQAGRTQIALDLLSLDVEDGESVPSQDIQLAYRKCHLLHNLGQFTEFADLATSLLKQYYSKGQSVKTDSEDEVTENFTGSMTIISKIEWYNLLVKTCQTLKNLERFQDMLEILQSALHKEKQKDLMDRFNVENLEFLLAFALYFFKDYKSCYVIMRNMSKMYVNNNRFMNLFSLVTNLANEAKHYRFCIRMSIKFFAEHPGFCYMNGFNALVRGSYKHALGEFVRSLRQNLEDPIANLCVALCFFHLANQKFIDKKHSVILQGFAFIKRYEKYRSECQETYYNLGRALHGIGLMHLAVHYYHKALETEPALPNDQYNLQREAAHNLALIYMDSHNEPMACEILSKYCVI